MRPDLFRLLPCLALAVGSQLHAAEKVVFPYEALVEAKEAYVRSGPGRTKYYPTGILKQGTKVTVQRHDQGWHMIFPPEGSFSWVPAAFVERNGNRGTITGDNVHVFPGSFESDIREYWQRKLSAGDVVQILAEKKLPPTSGKGPDELWYRIVPPRGEWRWVYGADLSPPPRPSDTEDPADPFTVRTNTPRRPASVPVVPTFDEGREQAAPPRPAAPREYLDNDDALPPRLQHGESGIVDRPIVRRQGKAPAETAAPAKSPAKSKGLGTKLDELERLDARLQSILEKRPIEWDFDDLERDYIYLRAEADGTDLVPMVDSRLARFPGYRKTRTEEEEIARIAEQTTKRDAELVELQKRHEFRLAAVRQALFDGAGIVQRSALDRRGGPKYALVAPSGKVTAYLVAAPGVDLESWVGRAAGITGARAPNPDLKADVITVRGLSPVRLAP